MGRLYEALDEQLAAWISAQPLLFVGIDGLSAMPEPAPGSTAQRSGESSTG